MKSLIILAITILVTGAVMASDTFFRKEEYKEIYEISFRIYVPKKIVPATGPSLLLFLHGMGERGNDNEKSLSHGARDVLSYIMEKELPVVFLVPQCPEDDLWVDVDFHASSHVMPACPSKPMLAVISLLEATITKYNINRNKIYVTGLSMGGFGTWDLLQRLPDKFAAAIPVCGGGDEQYAPNAARVPLWVFHGEADPVVNSERSRNMVKAVVKAGGNVRYTEYPGVGHGSWVETYKSEEVLLWLFSNAKGERTKKSANQE